MESEVRALVQLLDDPSPVVRQAVDERLRALGRAALPFLQEARQQAAPDLRARIDACYQSLHRRTLEAAWHAVMEAGADLERGAFLLALYAQPTLDVVPYQKQLDDWADAFRTRAADAGAMRRVLSLRTYFVHELGFRGNRADYYAAHNSYLDWVIDHRMGLPISLAAVFLLLAHRLHLPVFGVNMPAHFLVKYDGPRGELLLDLFNDGVLLAKDDAVRFLLKAGIEPHPAYFEAVGSRVILLRLVRNLLALARNRQDAQTAHDLARLHDPYAAV